MSRVAWRVIPMLALAVCLPAFASAPAAQPAVRIENAFSPDAKAEALVVKVIDTASSRIRLAAYSFSSPAVLAALIAAKERGVEVQVLVDYRRNRKPLNRAALDALVKAGIAVRTIAVYAMHHDKYIVADEQTVQNGSFNYTRDAAVSNSENVLVVWNNAQLAQSYIAHWESRWARALSYLPSVELTGKP